MRPVCRLLTAARTGVCLAAIVTTACAGRTTSAPSPDAGAQPPERTEDRARGDDDRTKDARCAAGPDSGAPIRRIGLLQRPDPDRAPVPADDAERLLFSLIYETLVTVDCEGRVRPGLATAWQRDPGTTTWTFTLREDARFTDGTPLTAPDIAVTWRDPGSLNGDLRDPVRHYLQSATAVDARTLAVTLHESRDDAPRTLAEPSLAITRRAAGSSWPLGTRGWQVASTAPAGTAPILLRRGAGVIDVAPAAPPGSDADPSEISVTVAASGDGRDLLDAGVDLLLTRDPAALSYAGTLGAFDTRPLPWTQTYVFVTPENAAPAPLTSEARDALAKDAVRGEARGAGIPAWWQEMQGCSMPPNRVPATALTSARIVYDQGDPVARDLAERVVALSLARRTDALGVVSELLRSPRTALQAAGLNPQGLATALARGNEAGYLLPVRRLPTDPCAELRRLTARAPWIAPTALVALVETRLQAIVRAGRSGLWLTGDGALVLTPADDAP